MDIAFLIVTLAAVVSVFAMPHAEPRKPLNPFRPR